MPIYLRGLLLFSNGKESVSSKELASLLAINPWQIRKDFSYFGEFGTPGVGYNAKKLTKQISRILKLSNGHKAALVGVGNLGTAVLAYPGFKMYGFDILAAYDINPKKIGRKVKNITIENISNLRSLKKKNIDIGIVAVPHESAQKVTDKLIDAGVKGILNFSSCHITVPKKIKVITIDIAMDLARLPYYMPAS